VNQPQDFPRVARGEASEVNPSAERPGIQSDLVRTGRLPSLDPGSDQSSPHVEQLDRDRPITRQLESQGCPAPEGLTTGDGEVKRAGGIFDGHGRHDA
jgi:hypothetical protein